MAKVSTYGLGGLGVSYSTDEISIGSKAFSLENLERDLGTEVAQGTFITDPGLTAFDYSPIFTADAGPLTSTPNIEQEEQVTPSSTSPTTRPYIWKKSS